MGSREIPAPEVYEQRAQTLLNSSDFKERKEGRQLIDEFLLHYPGHAKAAAMRKKDWEHIREVKSNIKENESPGTGKKKPKDG